MYFPAPKAGLLSTRIGIGAAARCGRPLVAAVHLRVVQPERAHRLVHPRRAGAGRAREPDFERVRRVVVGADEHRVEEGRRRGSRPTGAIVGAEHGHRDRELQGRRRGESRRRVPRSSAPGDEVLDVDAARPAEAAGEPRSRSARAPGRGEARRLEDRRAAAGRARARTRLDERRPAPSTAVTRTQTILAGSSTRSENRVPRSGRSASTRSPRRTITRRVPGGRRAGHEPERDLAGRGRDDRRRREGGCVEHALYSSASDTGVALRDADRRPPRPRCVLRGGGGARASGAPRGGRSSSAATRAAAASSRRRTTSRGASGSTRR